LIALTSGGEQPMLGLGRQRKLVNRHRESQVAKQGPLGDRFDCRQKFGAASFVTNRRLVFARFYR
jgi:hypothetical protein